MRTTPPSDVSRVRVDNLPPDVAVSSFALNGSKARDDLLLLKQDKSTLDISVVHARSEISGVVSGFRSDDSGHGSIVLFTVDPATRHRPFVRAMSVGPNGDFAIRNLPEGHYYVVAVNGVSPDLVMAPRTLRELESRATAVQIGIDARRSVTLRAVNW